jgi:hypothetical protein
MRGLLRGLVFAGHGVTCSILVMAYTQLGTLI